MVFGLFARRQQPVEQPAPASIPLPPSPPAAISTSSIDVQDTSGETMHQLRTPSPSIDSASLAQGRSTIASPAPTLTRNNSSCASTRQISEPLVLPTPVATEPPQPVLLPTRESLATLVTSIPAKVLHAYMLEQLPSASSTALESLCAFFNTLAPPPKLHCVRCHKDFVEVENDDRSCLVPHDDNSAEVERVGRSGEGRRTKEGTEYETLWGCCGKVTEGDGREGPPEGWCYEGKHTTDAKRARFRADSTAQIDKLISCIKLNCHGVRSRIPRAAGLARKRARKSYKEVSDDDGSDGASDSGMEEIAGGEISAKKPSVKKAGKGKETARQEEEKDKMQVDDDVVTEARTSVPHDGLTSKQQAGSDTAPKRRSRPSKAKTVPAVSAEGGRAVSPMPKRRGRARKSKALVEDLSVEATSGQNASTSPARRPRTPSTSRVKPASSVPRPGTEQTARRSVAKASKSHKTVDEDVDMGEDKPAKKRRIST